MSGSNLVLLAETSHKLSRGQAHDWRPHEQTQAIPDNNTLRPKLASGKNEQIAAHRGDFDSCVIITDNIREKIQWWELHVHNVMRNVLVPSPEHYIESDASNTGWGGILNPQNKNAPTARGQ